MPEQELAQMKMLVSDAGADDVTVAGAEAAAEVRLDPIANGYRTMPDLVFTTLRDEILSGRLRPGERLNSSQLAGLLGVSRMPVREAISRLTAVGLVENVPHRGAFVKQLSIEEVVETYYIRAALEGIAARLAVRHLTDADLRRLRDLCDDIDATFERGDDAAFLAHNLAFHSIISEAAHSARLQKLIKDFYDLSAQYRALGLNLPGRHEEIRLEHRHIADALATRDPERAELCAREHHINTARRIAASAGESV